MYAFSPLICLHMLSMSVLTVGVILGIIWAAKYLKKESLKKLAITLVVVGVVGAMLTAGRGWPMHKGSMRMHYEKMQDRGMMMDDAQMERMMDEMMEPQQ